MKEDNILATLAMYTFWTLVVAIALTIGLG